MKTRRLGCFSFTGFLAVAITFLLILVSGIVQGGAQFSPGALNDQPGELELGGVRTHAQTGGRCSACHSAPWDATDMDQLCLDCHTELLVDMQNFHAIMLTQAQATPCYDCHTDHNGKLASLTISELSKFPHQAVGFSLQEHAATTDGAAFACADCHGDDITTFQEQICQDCHAQIDERYQQTHLDDFGPDCLICHDGVDRYGANFDHNTLNFKLVDGHSSLACRDCHLNARSVSDLQIRDTSCTACHLKDDIHEGRFGLDCAACHTIDDWKKASFDHNLSNFPLTGAHEQVDCLDCHQEQVYAGTPTECEACHAEPAYHLNLFAITCQDCHTTNAWAPAEFQLAHTFPFDHGESGVSDCQVCHPSRLQEYTCYECHEHDPQEITQKHREEGLSDFENCMECHPTGEEDEGESDED
jgi:hypothetical protein